MNESVPKRGTICDFCPGGRGAVKEFAAKQAPVIKDGAVLFLSDDKWYACIDCAELVESSKAVELLDQAVDRAIVNYRLESNAHITLARDEIAHLHGVFWGNRAS